MQQTMPCIPVAHLASQDVTASLIASALQGTAAQMKILVAYYQHASFGPVAFPYDTRAKTMVNHNILMHCSMHRYLLAEH